MTGTRKQRAKKDEVRTFVRSSKCSLKFLNANQSDAVRELYNEYVRILRLAVDELWDAENVPTLPPKSVTGRLASETWLSARMIQCVCKQASGIVRGTRTKWHKTIKAIEYARESGNEKRETYLTKRLEGMKVSKPDVSGVEMELDSRFVSVDFESSTSFDIWLKLSSVGGKRKILLPLKRHKHFNSLFSEGKLLGGVRLGAKSVTFNFECVQPDAKKDGNVLGVDIGMKKVYVASDGQHVASDKHGHTMQSITDRLTRRRRGSKGFARAQAQRENFINMTVNRLNFTGVKTLRLENIRDLRRGRRTRRSLTSFVYPTIRRKLEDRAMRRGVRVEAVNPTYTSQRCSCCGWVEKSNRRLEQFKCRQCGNALDADLNASINIRLGLPSLPAGTREARPNRTGFYWAEEFIVPQSEKVHFNDLPLNG